MFKHNLKAVLNTQRPDKKGNYPLRIRMTIKRVVTYYPTNIMLKPDQLLNGEVVKHDNKHTINTYIRHRINEIEKSLLEQSITGNETAKIKKNIATKFTDYATKKINAWEGIQDKTTIRHKRSYLNKINEFNPSIKLVDFDKDILARLEEFCKGKGNINNTVWSCTKFVKTIINAAVEDGTLTKNPLKGFKGTRYSDPFRDTLTPEELKKFEEFANNELNIPKLLNVANWFLFSCYTGLRYGDLDSFKGFVNHKVLLQTEKTGEIVSIFATDKILEAKERITRAIFTNQKSNDYLRTIAATLGIDKKITFHTARHTFAVQFLERGGRIEILSKLLGHSSIKTTEIYAKISNKLIDAEMKRVWN